MAKFAEGTVAPVAHELDSQGQRLLPPVSP